MEQALEELIAGIRAAVPDFELKTKEDSRLMRVVAKLVWVFNKSFLHDFVTVVGTTVYAPKRIQRQPNLLFEILSHELVHLRNIQKQGAFTFYWKYFTPQVYALGAFLAPLSLWFLLCLLFLLPWPAPLRKEEELDGYTVSMFVSNCVNGLITRQRMDWIANQFTASNYYFMWPFKLDLWHELYKRRRQVYKKELDSRFPFALIKGILRRNGHLCTRETTNSVSHP